MPTLAFDAGTRAVQHVQDHQRAAREVASTLPNTHGLDNAAAVYGAAIELLGVDSADFNGNAAAMRQVYLAHQRGGSRPRVAMDSATVTDRAKRFPNANRLSGSAA